MTQIKQTFIFLFLLFSFVATGTVQAQSEKDFTTKYHAANQLMQQQKYTVAKNIFVELKLSHKNNIWPAYASYQSALASFYLKNYKLAEAELHNHLKNYPNWEKKDEVLVLLVNIYFIQKNDHIALSMSKKIQKSSLINETNTMKGHFLTKRSVQNLKNLHNVYPEDKFISQLLVNKIAVQSEDLEEVNFAKSLVKELSLKAPKFKIKGKEGIKNDTIYVAALLPLNIKTLTKFPSKSLPKMAVQLYWGMRLAKAKLDTTGSYVKLMVYDIRNNPDTLNYMYEKGEFDHIRLFVGPILDKDFEALLKIADKLNVPVINPALTKDKFINNRNAYFLNPTQETQASRAADFAKEKFDAKKVLILSSNISTQKKFANFHEVQAKANGMVVEKQIVSTIKINVLEEVLEKNKDLDYVFVASNSKVVADEIMSKMKEKGIDKPIITYYNWKNFQPFDKSKMEQHKVYFIAPDYIKGKRASERLTRVYNWRVHRRKRAKNFVGIPSYTFKGWDIMNSFAKNLYEHQDDFKGKIEDNPDFYNTFKGYSFTKKKHDNQFVPIVTYRNEKLMMVYPKPKMKRLKEKIEKK